MSDYLNNLLTRSFALPSPHDGQVVPRRSHEYETQNLELPQPSIETNYPDEVQPLARKENLPVTNAPAPTNFMVKAVENKQPASGTEPSVSRLVPFSEAVAQPSVTPQAETITMPQPVVPEIAHNVLPLPMVATAQPQIEPQKIPLVHPVTKPPLTKHQIVSQIVEREVFWPSPALPMPQVAKAKSSEALIPGKTDPLPAKAQVTEAQVVPAIFTSPTNEGSAIRPFIAPPIPTPVAPQEKSVAPVETVINVTIGRVEVRVAQTPAPPMRKQSSTATSVSLDDYLRKRNGGRG